MTFQTTVEDIMSTHHSLLRRELPKITELMNKLASEYPENASLTEAREIYTKVRSKVETHLKDEETILFPIGIALESGAKPVATEMDLLARLAEMEKEHDGCGKTLHSIEKTLRETVPESELRNKIVANIQLIQDDFILHVEKENTKVHPMFVSLLAAKHNADSIANNLQK